MRINGPAAEVPLPQGARIETEGSVSEPSFSSQLKDMVEGVDSLQKSADKAMEQAAVEGTNNIHETMIRVEEANVSMRMMLKVRNKALDAYQQLMRMQF